MSMPNLDELDCNTLFCLVLFRFDAVSHIC